MNGPGDARIDTTPKYHRFLGYAITAGGGCGNQTWARWCINPRVDKTR